METLPTKYSFWKGLRKTLVNMAIIGLPIVVQLAPEQWKNLSLGGLCYLIVNYLKVKWAEGTPNL